jgi:hypothetical protein
MVQMIPNAALVKGTVTAVENYTEQEGFFVITVLVADAGEKKGVKFLGASITAKEIKVLLSGDLQKKLKLQPSVTINGEIKKINPFLWRAAEDNFKVEAAAKVPKKPAKK